MKETDHRDSLVKTYLTPREAAKALHCSPATLANLRCKAQGPAYHKIGRRTLYDPEDIVQYIEDHKVLTETHPKH